MCCFRSHCSHDCPSQRESGSCHRHAEYGWTESDWSGVSSCETRGSDSSSVFIVFIIFPFRFILLLCLILARIISFCFYFLLFLFLLRIIITTVFLFLFAFFCILVFILRFLSSPRPCFSSSKPGEGSHVRGFRHSSRPAQEERR